MNAVPTAMREAKTFVSVCPLMGLVILAALGVLLFVRSGARGRRMALGVVGGMLGLVVLLGVIAVFFRSTHVLTAQRVQVAPLPEFVPHNAKPQAAGGGREFVGDVWAFDVNESFHDADIHPSARSAAKAVAWQFNAWLATYRVSNQKPRVVELTGNIGDEFLGEVADVIRRAADRPEVRLAAEATTRPTLELGREPITVAVETVAQAGGGGCVTGGTVNLVARFRANGLFTKAARFVDKPWVENFAAYVGTHPKSDWIIAQSRRFWNTPDEARSDAVAVAAEKLAGRVRQGLIRTRPIVLEDRELAEERLRGIIEVQLDRSHMINDPFAQSFRRPYGKVWRHAILIDASPKKVAVIKNSVHRALSARRTTWLRAVGSAMGLALVIVVVYLFLNAATKGYYTWSLRGAAVVLVVVALVAVLAAS